MADNTAAFRNARDQLLDQAMDYAKAMETFQWPVLLGRWNWAIDWFDEIARDNTHPALWIVEEDGNERIWTFAELSRRSSQVATWLHGLGVRKGDRVILMLGNQVELWETM